MADPREGSRLGDPRPIYFSCFSQDGFLISNMRIASLENLGSAPFFARQLD